MNLARWAPISGILYVALWVVVIFLLDSDPGDSDTDITSWYADSGNRDQQVIAFFLVLAAGLAFGLLTAQRPRPSPTEWALGIGVLALIAAWLR